MFVTGIMKKLYELILRKIWETVHLSRQVFAVVHPKLQFTLIFLQYCPMKRSETSKYI